MIRRTFNQLHASLYMLDDSAAKKNKKRDTHAKIAKDKKTLKAVNSETPKGKK